MSETETKNLDFLDIIKIIFNRKYYIITVFILALVISYFLVPIYFIEKYQTFAKMKLSNSNNIIQNNLLELRKDNQNRTDFSNKVLFNLIDQYFYDQNILEQLSNKSTIDIVETLYDNLSYSPEVPDNFVWIYYKHFDPEKKADLLIAHTKNLNDLAFKSLTQQIRNELNLRIDNYNTDIELLESKAKTFIENYLSERKRKLDEILLQNNDDFISLAIDSENNIRILDNISTVEIVSKDANIIKQEIDLIENQISNLDEYSGSGLTGRYLSDFNQNKVIYNTLKDLDKLLFLKRIADREISYVSDLENKNMHEIFLIDERSIKFRKIQSNKTIILLLPLLITVLSIFIYVIKDSNDVKS